MKRTSLLTAIICLCIFTTKAQLANTKWQGAIGILLDGKNPSDVQTIWDFHQDTLNITYPEGKLPTDVMSFSEDNKIITVRKISGGVPCDNSAVGKFTYEVKNDQLFIKELEDACPARASADLSRPLSRAK
jgi:hypothetical protein